MDLNLSFEALTIIAAALAFDYVNGFHDAANSIATVVSTRVLSPRIAVAWAAFWNFIAFAVFGTAVAKTIGTGTIDIDKVSSNNVLLAALIGAIAWDLITWFYGLPSSSSHALVGGLAGAAVAFGGWNTLLWGGIGKIALFIVLSPVLGVVLGIILMNLVEIVTQKLTSTSRVNLRQANWFFRKAQLFSAAAYSLGHGANDAQKTMGIIAAVILIDRGQSVADFEVTLPIVLMAHAAIALGTLTGGWRIVHTLGSKITKLQPVSGFAAETGAAITLFGTASLGIPVSTTHTITGSIIGVGATHRLSAIRWGVTGKVIYAWILTIPGSAIIAALAHELLVFVHADVVVIAGFLAALSWVALLFRHHRRMEAAVFAPPS
jgi:PiT family inorganic phosphate transporter